MNTKLLKQKILDLAIRGKLTQQLKSDGNTADLLKEISSACHPERSAKGAKSKDLKQIIPLDKNEAPFEIPANWEWVRLGNVCKVFGRIGFRGYTKKDLVEKGEGAISLSPSNMDEMKLNFDKCTYISWFKYEESPEIMINKGDIIVVKTGSSYGKTSIVQDLPEKTTLNPQLMVLKQINCNRNYLCYFLNSAYFRKVFEELVNGTAIPTFSQEKFSSKEFPLPPLAEQQRIVEKIQEAFAEIDSIENNKELLKTHIKQARQKILDLAIHGKLVPQNKTDEPASVLLERITRDNPHYEKMEDEPFEIPENWVWCRLGNICDKLIDGDHNPPKGLNCTTEYIMLSSRNINDNDIVDLENVRYLSKDMFEEENLRTKLEKGDILFTSVGSLGRSCVFSGDGKYCFQRSVSVIHTNIYNKYLKYFFDSNYYQKYIVENATGTAQLGFYLEQMRKSFIAIPPLNEQSRIVAKIEELFSTLDQMERNLV